MKTLEKLSIKHQVRYQFINDLHGPIGIQFCLCLDQQVSAAVCDQFTKNVGMAISGQVLNGAILPLSDRMNDIFKLRARSKTTSKGTVVRPRKIKEKHGKHL